MDLDQAGIALKCRCGAIMVSDMAGVLFEDKGRIKINKDSVRCGSCGAIYRRGERLKYTLVKMENRVG